MVGMQGRRKLGAGGMATLGISGVHLNPIRPSERPCGLQKVSRTNIVNARPYRSASSHKLNSQPILDTVSRGAAQKVSKNLRKMLN